MRCYTNQHTFYCGIDLHARSMYVCVVRQEGEILLHRNMQAAPAPFLKAVAPSREGLVVAVEGLFTWYWLADRCTAHGIPFVLGHALSMKTIHGGTAQNEKIDAQKIAVLLRGGMLPQASVDPAQMRATRDWLRRRTHLRRKRSELFSPVQNTTRPYHLPEIGKKIAYKANREGVAERLDAPAVQNTMAVDLALLTSYDARLKDLELSLLNTAKHHDANTLSLLQTIPGGGKILRLGRLYDIHQIERFPRVQEFASSCRLVKWRKAAGGNRLGTSGKQIGNAPLTGAFSAAATLFWRNHPQGQQLLARVEKTPDKGPALSMLAYTRGRAVYYMRKRQVAFDRAIFLQTSGSSAGEPGAALDAYGMSLHHARWLCQLACVGERHGGPRPFLPAPWRLLGPPSGFRRDGDGHTRGRGLPLPRAWYALVNHRRSARRLQRTVRGSGIIARSQRRPATRLCHRHARHVMMAPQDVCGAATSVGTQIQQSPQDTRPTDAAASDYPAEKKRSKPLSGAVCLLT
jgi:transposase